MGTASELLLGSMDDDEHKALAALVGIFGEETNVVLDALVVMACKLAIMSEVDPKTFAAGIKQTWDGMAKAINAQVQ